MISVIASLIIVSLILIFVSIYINTSYSRKFKRHRTTLDGLANTFIFKIIIDGLRPSANSLKESQLAEKLSKLPRTLSIPEYYLLKVLICLLSLVVSFSIYTTNYINFKEQTISKVIERNNSTSVSPDKLKFTATVSADQMKHYYKIVTSETSTSTIKSMSKSNAISLIQSILSRNGLNERDSSFLASDIYRNILSTRPIINSDSILVLCLSILIGYWFIDIAIWIYSKISKNSYDSEVYNLETIVIILGSRDSITVKEIIDNLILNSRLFRNTLLNFRDDYLVDRALAFNKIDAECDNTDFSRLIFALKMCEESDRAAAIDSIVKRREGKLESDKIDRDSKLERKDLYCLVLYFVVLLALMNLFLSPWATQFSLTSLVD